MAVLFVPPLHFSGRDKAGQGRDKSRLLGSHASILPGSWSARGRPAYPRGLKFARSGQFGRSWASWAVGGHSGRSWASMGDVGPVGPGCDGLGDPGPAGGAGRVSASVAVAFLSVAGMGAKNPRVPVAGLAGLVVIDLGRVRWHGWRCLKPSSHHPTPSPYPQPRWKKWPRCLWRRD